MAKDPVTRNDVARYAGVSTAVVSYVVNHGPRPVAPDTRERVLDAIRALGYRPNATARALRTGVTRTLGLITPDGGNPLFAELAKAIDRAAGERGYVVLQTSADGDPETERAKVAELLARRVSGLLMVAPAAAADLGKLTGPGAVPVVTINRELAGISSVRPDYRAGAERGVRHLIGHGHRRIGLIVGGPAGSERELGYRDAMPAVGPLVRAEFSRRGGYEAMKELLGAEEPPTAVFASSDLQGIGALKAIHEVGLRIPEDVAVVAFDGTAESEYCWPPLTVVRQPLELMAAEAVRRLVDGEPAVESLSCPTELILRQSCGC